MWHAGGVDSDFGLFGPHSVTWKVHSEPIVTLGGLRSLYLQALHPRAVAGVAQNSAYRTDPWGRFNRTSEYVGTVLYGTTAEVEAAAGRIRRVHSRMRATDPRTGEVFRIDEPDLLRWVHVTEVESFVTTARRAGLSLTDDEVDQYYTEQRRAAEMIGLDPGSVPGTATEVDAYYESVRPGLGLTKEGAETAAFLTVPPIPSDWGGQAFRLALTLGPARWGYLGVASTAIALLPPWARKIYGGLGWSTTDVTASLSARGMRLLLQGFLATLPTEYRIPPMRRAALERAGLA
ncbi:hypothetical protein Acsp02_27660 [Actinoplanes sp. NBRC 103695]|nr:hypothetical protein Acsp02_27660 [Actinoplanes sp. NBRC 103695]